MPQSFAPDPNEITEHDGNEQDVAGFLISPGDVDDVSPGICGHRNADDRKCKGPHEPAAGPVSAVGAHAYVPVVSECLAPSDVTSVSTMIELAGIAAPGQMMLRTIVELRPMQPQLSTTSSCKRTPRSSLAPGSTISNNGCQQS